MEESNHMSGFILFKTDVVEAEMGKVQGFGESKGQSTGCRLQGEFEVSAFVRDSKTMVLNPLGSHILHIRYFHYNS